MFFSYQIKLAYKSHVGKIVNGEEITNAFDNSDIISSQDNFKYMGDVPFTVCFDFETTAGNAVFLSKNVCSILLSDRCISFEPES